LRLEDEDEEGSRRDSTIGARMKIPLKDEGEFRVEEGRVERHGIEI